MSISSASFADSKKHFKILDALRGVAAMMVILFHVLEIFSGGDHAKQVINHGYLAVDFFFMLSGYVMAHAYDDRWNVMTVKDFFKRRIIRLHPMIIMGMTIGALLFYFGQSYVFPKIGGTGILQLLLVLLVGYTLLPLPVSMDIRGWNEMHPLNGPSWSLFFEYIANVLHALILRRLPKLLLSTLVFIAAAALIHMAVTSPQGDIIGGWSLEPEQLRIGFTRLLFPYMAGMLLRRMVKPVDGKSTFIQCSILLILMLALPRIGGQQQLWQNGLYDSLTVILVFPLIIFLGATGAIKNRFTEKLCTFLGDISYPMYIIHYPFIYALYAWVSKHEVSFAQGVLLAAGLLILMMLLAYATLKWYDEPVRKWLGKKFMRKH